MFSEYIADELHEAMVLEIKSFATVHERITDFVKSEADESLHADVDDITQCPNETIARHIKHKRHAWHFKLSKRRKNKIRKSPSGVSDSSQLSTNSTDSTGAHATSTTSPDGDAAKADVPLTMVHADGGDENATLLVPGEQPSRQVHWVSQHVGALWISIEMNIVLIVHMGL